VKKSIYFLDSSTTTIFAANELARYLRLMSSRPLVCEVSPVSEPSQEGIRLGLFSDLSIEGPPEASADIGADAVHIAIENGSGVIAGSNPRSVLLGVYRFLHELGYRWVRPGADGEYVPRLELAAANVTLDHSASLHHRVICIEGATSFENVLDIIDWAPKVGYSGYFMQFPDGFAFFDRWYSHTGDPNAEAEPFSTETSRAFAIRIEEAIRMRDLQYHAIGHGWHARAIGIDVSHWNPVYGEASPEVTGMLAEIDGKRRFNWDRPMITSLCFSQDKVRRRFVDVVVEHAVNHPEVDYLHVWIDDGFGQKCACEGCIKVKPSDLYVRMLGELDEALTAADCDMRMVFIGYSDLLWPPGDGAPPLRPERFSFVYANSRGSFPETLDHAYGKPVELPPFVHNRNRRLPDAAGFAGPLIGWQKYFEGDRMLFEYYSGLFDQVPLARRIHDDVGRLKGMRLNGLIDCQRQRVFFPTGLAHYVLGQALWNTEIDIDRTISDYHTAAYGEDGALAMEFVKLTVEEMDEAVRTVGGELRVQVDPHAHLDKLEGLLADFAAVCERNLHQPDPCRGRSWHYMRWYKRVVEQLVPLYRAVASDDRRAALQAWKKAKTWLFANEHHYQPVFDVWAFCKKFDKLVLDGYVSSAPEDVL
jgi:hypothetical protein